MRVACRNPVLLVLLRVQYLVSKQSRLCASKNWTRVSVGERKVPLRFKKVTWQSDSLIDSLAILGMKTETMKSLVLCENSWSQLNFSDSNYLWWFFTLSEDINKRTWANHDDDGNENVAKQKFNKQINSCARAL